MYALTKWLNCSPIYVVNRDDAEVEQFIDAFKKSATEAFNPELVHVKTVEEAEKLAAPGSSLLRYPFTPRLGLVRVCRWDSDLSSLSSAYIVSAVPAFPPTSPEEKQARAVAQTIL